MTLPGDGCAADWIWDREVETAPPADRLARAAAAWDEQLVHLLRDSRFYGLRLREAGVKAGLELADLPAGGARAADGGGDLGPGRGGGVRRLPNSELTFRGPAD